MMKNYRLKVFTDFDGTITKNDVWMSSVSKLIEDKEEFNNICEELYSGKIGTRETVIRQLEHAGLSVIGTLSVSNLRSVRLKKMVPREIMLGAEKVLQRPLAIVYFGPSIFFLVKKIRKSS